MLNVSPSIAFAQELQLCTAFERSNNGVYSTGSAAEVEPADSGSCLPGEPGSEADLLQPAFYGEAGAGFDPFMRINDAVAVFIGAEIAVALDNRGRVLIMRLLYQLAQYLTLFEGTVINDAAGAIHTPCVCYVDGVAVVAGHAVGDFVEVGQDVHSTVGGHQLVVAGAAPAEVAPMALNAFERLGLRPGGAVQYNKFNTPHCNSMMPAATAAAAMKILFALPLRFIFRSALARSRACLSYSTCKPW